MRIRTVMAATVVAVGATLALSGVASASTPTHGDPGRDAVFCAVPDQGATPLPTRTKRVQLADARPGWVVDDAGRTLAVEGWRIDDGGRVLSREGTVIAERGWIVCGQDEVVEARKGDCAERARLGYAEPARTEAIELYRAVPRG